MDSLIQHHRRRDRRQEPLYRRPLRARAGTGDHAGRGGVQGRQRPARRLPLRRPTTSGASSGSAPGCTTAARSRRRSTWSTRRPSWKPSTTASTKCARASRCCCATPRSPAEALAGGGRRPRPMPPAPRARPQLLDDFAFVAECNVGGEFMAPGAGRAHASASPSEPGCAISTTASAFATRNCCATRTSRSPSCRPPSTLLADKPHHVMPRTTERRARPEVRLQGEGARKTSTTSARLYNLASGPRHAHRGRALQDQRAHHPDHHHARPHALPEALEACARVRRHPPRDADRHRLSAQAEPQTNCRSRRGSWPSPTSSRR